MIPVRNRIYSIQRYPWRHCRCGGSDATQWRQIFLEDNAEMREAEHKFNVRKYNTLRLDESHRLVTTILVKSSYSRESQNIFQTIIVKAAR
jgi:hypothetical protein